MQITTNFMFVRTSVGERILGRWKECRHGCFPVSHISFCHASYPHSHASLVAIMHNSYQSRVSRRTTLHTMIRIHNRIFSLFCYRHTCNWDYLFDRAVAKDVAKCVNAPLIFEVCPTDNLLLSVRHIVECQDKCYTLNRPVWCAKYFSYIWKFRIGIYLEMKIWFCLVVVCAAVEGLYFKCTSDKACSLNWW